MRFKGVTTIAVLLAILFVACGPPRVDRERWDLMSRKEHILYVKSMMGAEQAKHAKGGGGERYPLPAEDYVARIDAAYAAGDERDVPAIFSELKTR